MKVTLNIENDAELRAYIKDCVKGQTLSVIRSELLEIIKEELSRKLKALNTHDAFTKMVNQALVSAIDSILRKEFGVNRWSDNFLRPFVENVVKEAIAGKDWNAMVNVLAKEKIKSLVG